MSHPFQILIVDDEEKSCDLIENLLRNHFPHVITNKAFDVNSAINQIKSRSPDVIFLDVQMRGETGFDLLDKIRVNSIVIFTTAYNEFAIKAFRYSATDYLLKPIDAAEFKQAVTKAFEKIKDNIDSTEQLAFLKEFKSVSKNPDKLTVPTADGFLFLSINDIIYCHSSGNYTEFNLAGNEKLLSSYTLGYYNEILEHHNFFRVHRSYLVNLSQIKMYKKGEGGILVMSNGDEIEIARTQKENFLKMFK
jgi:two-component system, LytTR family, response regulator